MNSTLVAEPTPTSQPDNTSNQATSNSQRQPLYGQPAQPNILGAIAGALLGQVVVTPNNQSGSYGGQAYGAPVSAYGAPPPSYAIPATPFGQAYGAPGRR